MAGGVTINKLRLSFGVINVNSMNVSTLGTRNSKSFIKVEGVTSFKHDVLFLCDVRLKDKELEIKRLFGLNKNESYKLYVNSSNESRGVAIAIKRKIAHEVQDTFNSVDQNIVMLKIKIKGVLCILGAIYGPNENNPGFFENLRNVIENWNLPYIIGGDFNTILDQSLGEFNMDRLGVGRVPNPRNANFINDWIADGNCFEPFRSLYPDQREISYIPFRVARGGLLYGKTRLDFFLVGDDIINVVRKVKYEERMSFDFDHKMVSLWLGKKQSVNKIKIFNGTLEHCLAEKIGIISIYDCINNHLTLRSEELARYIGNFMRGFQEYYDLERVMFNSVNPDICKQRYSYCLKGWTLILRICRQLGIS